MMIPDISGFTHFVNSTEIVHSVHIIAELLETIINANEMDLKVAELEGDAVFFYRIGPKPTQKEIFHQVGEMYTAFHKQLAVYERDRICNCGACKTANNLDIKFVSHYGEVVERTIKGHFQLMGPDVTLIHKFLKNSIDDTEYVLCTDDIRLTRDEMGIPDWVNVNESNENYDGVGEINYSFSSLKPLKLQLPPLIEKREIELIEDPIILTSLIKAPMEKVYALLIDSDLKLKWSSGLRDVIQEEERVQRIGSTHDCVLPIGTIHVETVDNVRSQDEVIYTEFTESSILLPAFYTRTTLKRLSDEETEMRNEVHYKGNYFKEKVIRLLMGRILLRSMTRFKNYVENNEVEFKIL